MKEYTTQDMESAMKIRGFSENTISIYLNHMKWLNRYYNRPLHTLSPDDIQRYQVYLKEERKVCWSTLNQAVCAMRFFLPR